MNTAARKISIIQQIASINNDALIKEIEQQLIKIRLKYKSEATEDVLVLTDKERHNLSARETELLLNINAGLPLAVQQRYEELSRKNVREEITETEHQELLQLLPQVEAKTVERLKYLVELGQLWNMSVDQVMKKLEINTPAPIHA